MTRIARAAVLIVVALSVVGGSACVRFVGPEDLRETLSSQAGVKLKQETGVTVTRSGIWLARQFVDTEEVPLKGVRRVEVGVYEVRGLKRGLETARPLQVELFERWRPLVRVKDTDQQVFVLTRTDDRERIRGLLVVVAEEDEWVLVRIRGKLDEIVEQTMRMAFEQANRPELYARTRQERGLDDSGAVPGTETVSAVTEGQRSTSFSSQE